MNKQARDILNVLNVKNFTNQRSLAEQSGHSLGIVNKAIKELLDEGYLNEDNSLTTKAKNELKSKAPKKAIILAAGFGMRMVPINLSVPKALLEVHGEILIERQIRQLHEVGVKDIYVVVGFMKERFEYLIDEFNVKLVVNQDYALKNNFHSMLLALKTMGHSNTYIVPGDIWCDVNPFSNTELYSWYMVSDLIDEDSEVRVNRKMELVQVKNGAGNAMLGITYLLEEDLLKVEERLKAIQDFDSFWEETLFQDGKMFISAKIVASTDVVEINTYEQLRDLDSDSEHLHSEALKTIADHFQVSIDDIVDIDVLKKGMTNRSFLFKCNNQKYIMRIPGEGTDQLIDRQGEAAVYKAIAGRGLCDDPVYLNPANGYKVTAFLEGVRVCNEHDENDVRKCMKLLKKFHDMNLKVNHEFDIFKEIEFYESLWNGKPSVYKDYEITKKNVWSLIPFIEANAGEKCLTHIDACQDNFLFYEDNGEEKLQLTDWEYAGMQDPHVDLAMFSIYAFYEKEDADRLIDIYFDGLCDKNTRVKIYCYMAACGLLWSNWCEYKRTLGVEFAEYSIRQYRYAKEFYRYAKEEMEQNID